MHADTSGKSAEITVCVVGLTSRGFSILTNVTITKLAPAAVAVDPNAAAANTASAPLSTDFIFDS
jgi:hypothetical protein